MLLNEPQPTPYDLNFQILGFPVRVHPAFFLMPLILGAGFLSLAEGNAGVALLVLELVFFLSILVHELGHTLAFRYYGLESRIVLYWLGGLAIPDNGFGNWNGGRRRGSLTPFAQAVIAFAGPLAGFLLAGVLLGTVFALGGNIRLSGGDIIPVLIPDFRQTDYANNPSLIIFFFAGIWANIFWNVLNLVPVFPLDGGQICRQLLVIQDPWQGLQRAAWVGVIAGGAVAAWGISRQQPFMAMMFGMLAYQNFLIAQNQGGSSRGPW